MLQPAYSDMSVFGQLYDNCNSPMSARGEGCVLFFARNSRPDSLCGIAAKRWSNGFGRRPTEKSVCSSTSGCC